MHRRLGVCAPRKLGDLLGDSESAKFASVIQPFHVNTSDSSSTRPSAAEPNKLLDSSLLSLGNSLDTAIRKISHPSHNAQSSGNFSHLSPEEDSLDESVYQYSRPDFHLRDRIQAGERSITLAGIPGTLRAAHRLVDGQAVCGDAI